MATEWVGPTRPKGALQGRPRAALPTPGQPLATWGSGHLPCCSGWVWGSINAGRGGAGRGQGSTFPFRRLWDAGHWSAPSSVTGTEKLRGSLPLPLAHHLLCSIAQFIQLHRAGQVTQQPNHPKGEAGVDSSLDSDGQSPPGAPNQAESRPDGQRTQGTGWGSVGPGEMREGSREITPEPQGLNVTFKTTPGSHSTPRPPEKAITLQGRFPVSGSAPSGQSSKALGIHGFVN